MLHQFSLLFVLPLLLLLLPPLLQLLRRELLLFLQLILLLLILLRLSFHINLYKILFQNQIGFLRDFTQPAITCLNSLIEALEQDVKHF